MAQPSQLAAKFVDKQLLKTFALNGLFCLLESTSKIVLLAKQE